MAEHGTLGACGSLWPWPAAQSVDIASLVIDPFAEVGCRGTGESSLLCDQPQCDCTQPIGTDPCFSDGCECFCATHLETMGFYAPPR